MDMNHSTSGERQSEATGKKPYEKPSFRYEKIFVTSALSCGKITSTDLNCHTLSAS